MFVIFVVNHLVRAARYAVDGIDAMDQGHSAF